MVNVPFQPVPVRKAASDVFELPIVTPDGMTTRFGVEEDHTEGENKLEIVTLVALDNVTTTSQACSLHACEVAGLPPPQKLSATV